METFKWVIIWGMTKSGTAEGWDAVNYKETSLTQIREGVWKSSQRNSPIWHLKDELASSGGGEWTTVNPGVTVPGASENWISGQLRSRVRKEQSKEGAGANEETLEGAASWTALEAVIELHPKISGKPGSDMVRFAYWKMIVEMTWRRKRLAARRPGCGMVRDNESLDSCFICWNGVKITDAHRAMMSWEDRVWTSWSTLLLSGEGNGYSLQYSCLEKSHGQRSVAGYSPCSHKSWTHLSN